MTTTAVRAASATWVTHDFASMSAYERCMFADKCSFLHYSFARGHHDTASSGLEEIMQTGAEMREVVKTLRLEVDRLDNVTVKLLEEVNVERGKGLEKDSGSSQEHMWTLPAVVVGPRWTLG